ncbi:unnamed protein product [Allacma fusca]|uniref:Aromatic-L-amino-acid decarboxylase n=1 Tax=Allacma fusca TaxID=39272 RepID=A0A8J2LV86_9HEXA|nr:unnamed protein product [Allacma fusca]
MDAEGFKEFGTEMMNFITEYLEGIRERKVLSSVKPGYLRELIPTEVPEEGEKWQDVMKDLERVIMPGVSHWQHPQFHAYLAAANSYPSIVADMLCGAIACTGFSWITSPACTELEIVMMDWLGKLLELPSKFLSCESNGVGGGVIQGAASEATFVALLAARAQAIRRIKSETGLDDGYIIGKLVAYTSDQSHTSVEKAGRLGGVKMRLLPTDEHLQVTLEVLMNAITEDKSKGLFPFYAVATSGTTNTCAFDDLEVFGDICRQENLWLHVDAAYAGAAFACEEFRYLMKGIDKAHSFNFNPHKWMLTNFDCSAMWVDNAKELEQTFEIDAIYLRHHAQGQVPDYRNWQIPFGRRFRSLKLWFVLRIYGKKAIQEHIRTHIALAHEFEQLLLKDGRFEIVAPVLMGLVCFRLKNRSNEENETLLKTVVERGKIYVVPTKVHGKYAIRFAICSKFTASVDMAIGFQEFSAAASDLFGKM